MTRILAAMTVVMMMGCGVGQAAFYCDDPFFSSVEIEDGAKVTCDDIHRATRLARDLALDSQMMMDFETRAKSVIVFVHKDECWNHVCGLTNVNFGSRVSWPYVEVGSSMLGLLHEMWHVQDAQNLYFPSAEASHAKWEWNGRYAVSAIFQLELTGNFRKGTEKQAVTSMPKLIESALRGQGWGTQINEWMATK